MVAEPAFKITSTEPMQLADVQQVEKNAEQVVLDHDTFNPS